VVKAYRNQENGAMANSLPRFGLVLKQARVSQGLSQVHLAALAGIERGFLGKVERGEANPSFTTLEKLAAAMKKPLSELIYDYERTE
jgi:transcriptional regulator with XRE-family HTH domain